MLCSQRDSVGLGQRGVTSVEELVELIRICKVDVG